MQRCEFSLPRRHAQHVLHPAESGPTVGGEGAERGAKGTGVGVAGRYGDALRPHISTVDEKGREALPSAAASDAAGDNRWIYEYFRAADSLDLDRLLSQHTDDVRLTFANHPTVGGKEKFREAIGGLWAAIKGMSRHTLLCHRPLKPSIAFWKPGSRGGREHPYHSQSRTQPAHAPGAVGELVGALEDGVVLGLCVPGQPVTAPALEQRIDGGACAYRGHDPGIGQGPVQAHGGELFVIELATRRVCIAGITVQPDACWMMQVTRNLLDVVDGPLVDKQYLILDRDTKYCSEFRHALAREGIQVIRLPPRSPNLNGFAERYVRSVKEECLSRLVPIGQGVLRRALQAYDAHYHLERNHQGLGNALITPRPVPAHQNGPIARDLAAF